LNDRYVSWVALSCFVPENLTGVGTHGRRHTVAYLVSIFRLVHSDRRSRTWLFQRGKKIFLDGSESGRVFGL
jgi:hypothetical protein